MSPSGADLDQLLEELERRDLIRREDRSIIEGQQQFAFTHILIRDVAYELLPRADRARRHALIAEFFERSTGVVERGDRRTRAALARRGRPRARGRPARPRRRAGGARLGEGPRGRCSTERRSSSCPRTTTEQRSVLRRRLALASTASFHLDDVRRPGNPPA